MTIHDDSAAPNYFDPPNIIVKPGTIVKWVNADSVGRALKAQDGSFQSPLIPPGGSWSHTFNAVGSFNYSDQRPYTTGNVTVR